MMLTLSGNAFQSPDANGGIRAA